MCGNFTLCAPGKRFFSIEVFSIEYEKLNAIM